jgi:hypothetical protein
MTQNTPKLTQLYDEDLPKVGNRVWSVDRVEEMDGLAKKIKAFNERLQGSDTKGLGEVGEQSSFKPGTKYSTMDVLGNRFNLVIPAVNPGEKLELQATPYHILAKARGNTTVPLADRALWKITAVNVGHGATGECHKSSAGLKSDYSSYHFWRDRWEGLITHVDGNVWRKREKHEGGNGNYHSEFVSWSELTDKQLAEDSLLLQQWTNKREMLQKHIREFGKQLINVDKIICFGLGGLKSNLPKTFVQHLAAVTVRDEIYKLRGRKGAKIEIIAQDPAYCANCAKVLKDVLNITAVTGFEGHLSLTRNTFVISVLPGGPVGQMVADLTLDFGGPATMLCDAIDDDYMAPEHTPLGHYHSDEPTRNMVAYKQRCEIRDFSDAMNVLGMTYAAFENEYPTVTGTLLRQWVEDQKKDIRGIGPPYTEQWLEDRVNELLKGCEEGKRKLTPLTDDEKEYVRKCNSFHKLETDVYFRTSALCVRKDL